MLSHAQHFFRRTSVLALVCLTFCSLLVSGFPTTDHDSSRTGQFPLNGEQSQRLLSQKNVREGEEDNGNGLSTMDYVWIGLGCLAAVIIISCIISYLFCECVKQIICLPCTCLTCCCD